MKHYYKIFVAFVILSSCSQKNKINDNYKFCFYQNYDYSNIYWGDLPVIPSGCDSAKWNDSYIVTKSKPWRCNTRKVCFYIINMKEYGNDPRQELSDGIVGPLSIDEFIIKDPLKSKDFIGASEDY
jgi:hypothetical protein